MVFRDQRLICKECGRTFFFTVTEQRRLAEQVGEEGIETPELCPLHRRSESPPSPARTERVERPEREKHAEPVERAEHRERIARETEPRDSGRQAPAVQVDDFPLEVEGVELKLIGEVKWFNRRKGYGFVTMADGEEVFFHRSDVAGGHLSQIRDGVQVEFQVRRTEKGMEAFNVSLLPPR